MQKTLPLLCYFLLVVPICSWGQGYLIQYVSDAGNPGGVSSASDGEATGWTTVFSATTSVNAYSDVIPLPFPFEYYGDTVYGCVASPNGLLTFDTLAASPPISDESLPAPSLPAQGVVAFWDQFVPITSSDAIRWKVFGTAPNRQLWIKWHSMPLGSANYAYFSVVLEEETHRLYVVDQWSFGATEVARVGLQRDDTTFASAGDSLSLRNNGNGVSDNDYFTFRPLVDGVEAIMDRVGLSNAVKRGCGNSSEWITIEFSNGGTDTITELLAYYVLNGGSPVVDTVSMTLTPGMTDTHVFSVPADLSSPGTYDITCGVYAVGDVNANNDTLVASVATVAPDTLPLLPVDFTGYFSSNLPSISPGWWEGRGATSPDSGYAAWVGDAFGNDPSHPNGKATRITLNATSNEDWIVSPKFFVEPGTYLRYELAMTQSGSTAAGSLGPDDSLQVRISTDCGESYVPLRTYDSSTVISPLGQREYINLSAFAGQAVRIAFYADEGNTSSSQAVDVFLDNIFLDIPDTLNVAVTELLFPQDQACGDSAMYVAVVVENLGIFTVDSLSVVLEVQRADSSFAQSATLLTPLPYEGRDTLLIGPLNTHAGGTYTLVAATSLADDQDPSNNLVSATVNLRSLSPLEIGGMDQVCPGNSANLFAEGILYADSEIRWSLDGVQVAVGGTFQTGPLTESMVYVVERVDTLSGCITAPTIVSVTVLPATTAGLVIDSLGELYVRVGSAANHADSVRYDYGDGSGVSADSTHVYAVNGTYLVCQYAFGVCGIDTTCQSVNVLCDETVAGFAVDSSGELFVALVDTSYRVDSVRYDYGDGSGLSTDVTHTYTSGGTYDICQYVYGFCNNDTICQTVEIQCDLASGGFVVDSMGDLFVSVSDTSLRADSVAYDFGDGSVLLVAPSGTHQYADTGTYIIQQVAYHFCGNDTTLIEVQISCEIPDAEFDLTALEARSIQVVHEIEDVDSIYVDFGDGTTVFLGGNDTTHVYDEDGSYTVCMTVYHFCGVDSSCKAVQILTTGIAQQEAAPDVQVAVFPNPNDGTFVVRASVPTASSLALTLTDLRGRVVRTHSLGQRSGLVEVPVNWSGLTPGLYLLQVQVDGQSYVQRLEVRD